MHRDRLHALRRNGALALRASSLALWGLVVFLAASFVGAGETFGQAENHATLVIAYGGGRVERYCVAFDEEEISGAELLERAGVPVVFSGFGGLGTGVCRIDDTGCSNPGDCFCQCRGADCHYWSYFTMEGGAWDYENVGASQRTIHDGDVDGWVWGNGHTPPPEAGGSGACAVPTAPRAPPTATRAAALQTSPSVPAAGGEAPSEDGPTAGRGGQAAPAARASTQTAAGETPEGTPTPQSEVRGDVKRRADRAGEPVEANGDGGWDAVPTGLFAFAVVAAVMTAGVGGLLLRRRLHG